MQYVYTYYIIFIYRYVRIYGTVSDIYGVNLFAKPGMQLFVSPLEYKIFTLILAVIIHYLLLVTMTRMKLLSALQLMFQSNKTMPGMQCAVYALDHKVFTLIFAATSQCLLLIARFSVTLLRVLQLIFQLNRIGKLLMPVIEAVCCGIICLVCGNVMHQ